MAEEFRDAEHVLQLATADGERDIELWHPEGCEQAKDTRGYPFYDCGLSHELSEWGLDLNLRDVPDGIYLATFWATGPGWAGPTPIEADTGIELTRLEEVSTDG
jgi:hypothetical protein